MRNMEADQDGAGNAMEGGQCGVLWLWCWSLGAELVIILVPLDLRNFVIPEVYMLDDTKPK